jgi:zinc protease
MRSLIATSLLLAAALPAQALTPKAPEMPVSSIKLPGSGVPLYGMQDGRLPRVWYHLYLEAGERFVPARVAGLAGAVAKLLDRGPADMPLADYRREMFRRGADVRWEAGNRFLIAHVKCLPGDLGATTALLARTVRKPRLDDATVKQVLDVVVNERKALDDSMRDVTFIYGKQKLWDFRPEARQPEGWPESVAAVGKADLQGFIKQHLAHPNGFVATVAPITPQRVSFTLAPELAGWVKPFQGKRAAMPTQVMNRRVVMIDKPGATDNQIYALSPLPLDLTGKEAAAAEVFFAGMGYDLDARLGKALRVQRGLTYHAGSGLRRVEWPQWYAYSFGGITQTPKIVAGLFELFGEARSGLSAAEVAKAKSALLQGYAADMESPTQQLDAVAAAVATGLPPGYPFSRPKLIAGVTADAVKLPASLAAGLDHATIVIMGDMSKIRQPVVEALPKDTPVEVRKLEELGKEALTAASH